MAREQFRTKDFREDSLARIRECNEIIDGYMAQGLRLTLRQLYYQLVVRNAVTNTERSYQNLSSLVSDARLAGLMDWEAIEDRGRVPMAPRDWQSLTALTEEALDRYRLPRWEGQSRYCELWVEKQALAGVLEPIAADYHVTLMVNKGYSSMSAMYEAAKRYLGQTLGLERAFCNACKGSGSCSTCGGDGISLAFASGGVSCPDCSDGVCRECNGSGETSERTKEPWLFYLGDHDPSGEDMVRDIKERMLMFGVHGIRVFKLALTMKQIQKYNPPPNPAKLSDSRAAAYIEKYGDESWEVDALPPQVLSQIIRDAFDRIVDRSVMDAIIARETKDKERLRKAISKLE
jgi:hypothetical protein